MRSLAESEILPMSAEEYGKDIKKYVTSVQEKYKKVFDQIPGKIGEHSLILIEVIGQTPIVCLKTYDIIKNIDQIIVHWNIYICI